ncbi:chaperonin 10-like protein [Talaromyces proteolyticus]|uniref:D-xylulose reductase n=1 Tax=Talaromyces proteolyticus TaxID=1131652 RepID=A0AAD4PY38_9EURO|nr:chaperonin 10-like protein [Talaromyces proteolyticus]KAH8694210.1 chaperonin 10-like protein [Talaromyces proteolyticus]
MSSIKQMKNPSWFLSGPHSADIRDHLPASNDIPQIKDPHDVLIQISYVGVCGSDVHNSPLSYVEQAHPTIQVHFWQHGGIQVFVSPSSPLILGHEASGTIVSVGSSVTSIIPGDRVAIEPGFPCRRCTYCKKGKYNLCAEMRFAADPTHNQHGTLTKYYLAPADFVFRLPDDMSLQEGVLVEPLSVAVHTVRHLGLRAGEDLVVMGSGTIGLLSARVARSFGAGRIVLCDVLPAKLEFAKGYIENCETFLLNKDASPEDESERLRNTLFSAAKASSDEDSRGVDNVIEASGAASAVQIGIYILRPGGSYIQAGMSGRMKIEFPINAFGAKELNLKGCFRYGPGDYELAMKLLTAGRVAVKDLISSVTPFENAPDAWEKTARGEGIKNLIEGVKG